MPTNRKKFISKCVTRSRILWPSKIRKALKYLILSILAISLILLVSKISVNVLNSDLYGRMIKTESFHLFNTENEQTESLPTITLILYKNIEHENSIEASLAINYNRQKVFKHFETDSLQLIVRSTDGYSYSPSGVTNTFNFTDNIQLKTYGHLYSGFETDRFLIPIAPSLNGFPYDDLKIRPMIDLYVNGINSKFNFAIQKRIPGRILTNSVKDKEIVVLTRTSTEKYLVMISSIVFLMLTAILTYGLFTTKKGLSTVEELIAVAGYILATAGFKELTGINRVNGTSALEIIVILIPLLSVFLGLIYSMHRGKQMPMDG